MGTQLHVDNERRWVGIATISLFIAYSLVAASSCRSGLTIHSSGRSTNAG